MTPEYHAVAAVLGALPIARRDRLTTWLWRHAGPFDAWNLDALAQAERAIDSQGV
jgi:hypothetical protein